MSRQTQGSLALVGVIAAGVFLIAFLVLLLIGDFSFSPAAFLALIVAFVAALLLFKGFHSKVEPPEATKAATAEALAKVRAAEAEQRAEPAPSVPAADTASAPAPAAAPEPKPEAAPAAVMPAAVAEAPSVETIAPMKLEGPRDGAADDLKKIKGVGPKLEALLHRMGFYHYDQIANWTASEVAWVDDNLEGFKGRVSRDDWVDQAKLLATGAETEFSKRVDQGDVY